MYIQCSPPPDSHAVCAIPTGTEFPDVDPGAWRFSKSQGENKPTTDGPEWPHFALKPELTWTQKEGGCTRRDTKDQRASSRPCPPERGRSDSDQEKRLSGDAGRVGRMKVGGEEI